MSYISIKNTLINQVSKIDPSVDTSPGSNFRDLVINPMALMFEQYELEQTKVLRNLSLADPLEYTEAELDAVAANFMIERKQGAYHTGSIRLIYSEPTSINIPEGTEFVATNGNTYVASRAYVYARQQMATNPTDTGYYQTEDISVRSTFRSDQGTLASDSALNNTSLAPKPLRIIVSEDISGGSANETNEQFYERLQNTVKTTSLASESVLTSEIKALTNSIQDVVVVSAGSEFMTRDLVAYDQLSANEIESFRYVKPLDYLNTETKQHVAYWNNFLVESVASGSSTDITFPLDPSDWVTEFTQEQYEGINQLVSGRTATQDQYQILSNDTFTQDEYLNYIKSEGLTRDNQLIRPRDIRLEGSSVILGYTPQGPLDTDVILDKDTIQLWEEDLAAAIDSGNIEAIKYIRDQLKTRSDIEEAANTAPILHRPITQHVGISIETTITTSDQTELGQMAYITCLRNDTIFMPFDGLGMAYRKQPGFLLRLNSDTYGGNTELREQDINKFKDYFNVDPVAENLIGSNILRDGAGNDAYWLYNVYLVDNNALDEEVQIGTSKVFDAINGVNQYLQRAKVWIEPNVSYDFKVDIQKNFSIKGYYKPTSLSDYTEILSKGATFPEYIPAAGEKLTSGNSAIQALNSERGHVGIGVVNTKGYEWAVDSFFVRSIVQTFPMHLFSFKIDFDKWPSSVSPFTVDYWGVGYDPNVYADNGNSGASRTQAAVWNDSTSSWELVGTHTATIAGDAGEKKLTKEFGNLLNYADTDGYIHVAASAANFGPGFENNLDHNLISYYIQLSNGNAGKKALGNAVDVYCFSPSNLSEKSVTKTVTANNDLIINEPYLCDIVEVREALSETVLPVGTYQVYNTKTGETYSQDNEYTLTFIGNDIGGTSITVIYRTWTDASLVNAFLNDPENRYPAVSLKEKAMPLAVVTINSLEFSGPITEEDAKQALISHINNIPDRIIEKSDIINSLYTAGADSVSLDMDITIKQHDTHMNVNIVNLTGGSYEVPNTTFSKFYTNLNLLDGVTKV